MDRTQAYGKNQQRGSPFLWQILPNLRLPHASSQMDAFISCMKILEQELLWQPNFPILPKTVHVWLFPRGGIFIILLIFIYLLAFSPRARKFRAGFQAFVALINLLFGIFGSYLCCLLCVVLFSTSALNVSCHSGSGELKIHPLIGVY